MFRRVVKLSSLTVGFAASGALVYSEDARKAIRVDFFSATPGQTGDVGPFSHLSRFLRTALNVGLTTIDYKWSFYGIDKNLNPKEYKEALKGANERAAKRLFDVCYRHGGLYTKFGQVVANMDHALPPEFSKALVPLQDKAKEMPPEMAIQVVRDQLGEDAFETIFESFEEKPIAAASLAQVHRAVLKDTGDIVAVKLQYPYLQSQVEGDIATLRCISQFIGFWFPEFEYTWMTPEFENNSTLELNFIQEARNAERMAKMFKHRADVRVPKIYHELTTERVLTMEFVQSIKISDIDALEAADINPLEVASSVSSVFGDMIHVHGFVHCDPHPGNLGVIPVSSTFWEKTLAVVSAAGYASMIPLMLLVGLAEPGSLAAIAGGIGAIAMTTFSGLSRLLLNEQQLRRHSYAGSNGGRLYQVVVFDHGMYRRLDPNFRTSYCLLWKALLLRSQTLGHQAMTQLGMPEKYFEILSVLFTSRPSTDKAKTGEKLSKLEREKIRQKFKNVEAQDINDFLRGLPRDLLFVMRSTNIVRSINLSLGGSSRSRLYVMGTSAVQGLEVPNPKSTKLKQEGFTDPSVPLNGPYSINLPVTSEVVNTEKLSYRQSFEIWRLHVFLKLIDSSWGLLAAAFSGF